MVRFILYLFFIFLAIDLFAQSDSTSVSEEEIDLVELHSPAKATLLSAVIPGAGQVYNKKAWKVPIVYGGAAVCIYFISDNNKFYHRYRDAYIAEADGDPSTNQDTGFSEGQLEQLQDTRRKWRDLSWISLAGVYILNIIDANVDAHLFHFDVNKDLSFDIRPYVGHSAGVNAGIGLSLNF